MPLLGIDHIELYVGNAVQAAHFFTHALGFRETAFAGLETGMRDRSTRVVEQGRIRFVLTAPLHGGSEITRHLADHGDGVKVVGCRCPMPRRPTASRFAAAPAACSSRTPVSDEHGKVTMATIATYGETVHTFVERDGYEGAVPARLRAGRGRRTATRACSPASTTWSATSSSAAWRSGSATTSASSASPR